MSRERSDLSTPLPQPVWWVKVRNDAGLVGRTLVDANFDGAGGEVDMAELSEEMKEVVARQRLGFVATVSPDGTPNLSPKGTVSVLDDEHLIFADIRSPGTVSNLRANPNVEVNVVDHFVRKGYRFKGTAEILDSGAEFDRHVAWFSGRGLFDAPRRIRSIVIVRVDQARPLISPGYDYVPDEAAARDYWLNYYVDQATSDRDIPAENE